MSLSVAMNPRTQLVIFVISTPLFSKEFSFVYPLYNFEKALVIEINVALPSYIQIVGRLFGVFPFFAPTHFGHLPSIEVFLHFFEAKHLGRQQWVTFNGVAGRALLSLFQ